MGKVGIFSLGLAIGVGVVRSNLKAVNSRSVQNVWSYCFGAHGPNRVPADFRDPICDRNPRCRQHQPHCGFSNRNYAVSRRHSRSSWPDPNAPPNWQILGHISNTKPSAIFKVSNFKKLEDLGAMNMMFGQSQIVHNAQLGIAIESLANIQEIVPSNNPSSNITFAQKMLENFMNFILSFTTTQTQMMPDPTMTYVPLNAVQNWYANFERRLQQNPNFWKT